MKTINLLPTKLISKIAAGEVIERPAYAVKELVENGIDSGANHITIHIQEAGLKQITVIDNGSGMGREDLEESIKLHTTSKLTTDDELARIPTLGFRGEALASIAAISHLVLQSRTKEQTSGTSIQLTDGKIEKITPIGMPVGTKIVVSNLFHSVPGRKKFLKSTRTETRHIIDVITDIALAHPEIHFILIHNRKTILDLPKTEHSIERIAKLLGKTIYEGLLPVSLQTSYVTLSGFVTKPQITTPAQKYHLFINGRVISSPLIAHAVKEAFGTLIDPKSHPVFILSVVLPYDLIDVNVHPRKETVRFVDNQLLYDTTFKAITETLMGGNLLYYADNLAALTLGDKSWRTGKTKSVAGRLLKENQVPWDIRPLPELSGTEIAQFHNVYLFTQTKYGIAIVDQHAAHERILYEQFKEGFTTEKTEQGQYHLATPLGFDVTLSEAELLQQHRDLFIKLGFEIEHFKDNNFLLHAVPLVFQDRNPLQIIRELLKDLHEEKNIKAIDSVTSKMLAYLACRAAVKAGEHLTKKQCKDLIKKLERTPNNTNCPHGRPTKVIIELDKIDRMFKRR